MRARKSKLRVMAGVFAVSIGAAPVAMSRVSQACLEPVETIDIAPRVSRDRLASDASQPAGPPMRRSSWWRGRPCSIS